MTASLKVTIMNTAGIFMKLSEIFELMRMIWLTELSSLCLLLCGNARSSCCICPRLCIKIQLEKDTMCVHWERWRTLSRWYISGRRKIKMFLLCKAVFCNLITWNLKDDDIRWKRGHFYGSVNSLCTNFKGFLHNLDIVHSVLASSTIYLLNYLKLYQPGSS